ncbi:MAG: LptA/OstA family protein [Pseudomonadota bacterium]
MSKTRLFLLAATTAAAMALPGVGGAQVAGSASDAPVAWGGDLFEYTPNGFTLTGRAEMTQGGNRLRANRITFVTRNGDLTQAEANGEVYFVTPEQTMRGDRAVYDLGTDVVTVTGDVILTQGQNVVTGGRLTYNVSTEAARMEGGAAAQGGRVRGVFYPESQN